MTSEGDFESTVLMMAWTRIILEYRLNFQDALNLGALRQLLFLGLVNLDQLTHRQIEQDILRATGDTGAGNISENRC